MGQLSLFEVAPTERPRGDARRLACSAWHGLLYARKRRAGLDNLPPITDEQLREAELRWTHAKNGMRGRR